MLEAKRRTRNNRASQSDDLKVCNTYILAGMLNCEPCLNITTHLVLRDASGLHHHVSEVTHKCAVLQIGHVAVDGRAVACAVHFGDYYHKLHVQSVPTPHKLAQKLQSGIVAS